MNRARNDLEDAFYKGLNAKNKGLPTGIPKLDRAIHGIQQGVLIGLAGSPKSGKSTLCDSAFLLSPYLYSLTRDDLNLKVFYWSLEMDKVSVRFRSIAYFFYVDYNISTVTLAPGRTYMGSNIFTMSSSYLLGKLQDDAGKDIVVSERHQTMVIDIINNRINPMFGEYSSNGKKLSTGVVDIIEDRNDSNPTGIYNNLMDYAATKGTFSYETYTKSGGATGKRLSGYTPNNPDDRVIVIIDHMRALKRERGFTMKQNMDKLTEYQIIIRNLCKYTFVDILHLNRNISDIQRIKFNNEFLYPNDDDLKDSGNLSEDADYLITMFDASDDRYGIKKHFDLDITDIFNYRSIHLVRSRHSEAPVHIQTRFYPGVLRFEQI